MTWLDWLLLFQLGVLTVRGLLRGTIAQVFAFLGLGFGTWAVLLVGAWIGQHWAGARPVAVYMALRWLVAALAGLAVAAVFQWWGDTISKAAHEGPFGWLDRLAGGVIGAAMGLGIAALVLLALLQTPILAATGRIGARAAYARPLMRGGVAVTGFAAPGVPGASWLHGRFVAAGGRLGGAGAPAAVKPTR